MNRSVENCTEILIALSEDDDPEVAERSRSTLKKFLEVPITNFNITEVVEENLYNVLTRLPRIMNEMDLTKKVNALNLLVGYLRLIGPRHSRAILQLSSHLKRFILTLIHVSQLERSHVSLFEDHAMRGMCHS